MNKNTRNWILGILVAAIVIAVLCIGLIGSGSPKHSSGSDREDNNHSQHQGTEHDTANPEAPPTDENLDRYQKDQDKIMSEMMEQMENIKKSGSASVDFLAGMIPHHESAIAMAESYLKYGGENQELRQIAEDIITGQKKEIQQMDSMMKEIQKAGETDREKEEAYLEEYNNMMTRHHSSHAAGVTVDLAFAEGMTLHHQMAVEMSEAVLGNTEHEGVRTLAQTIIDTQKQEISQMQEILKTINQTIN